MNVLNKIKPGIADTMKRLPEDIFINDNDKYRSIFNPLICPFTDRVEKFYETSGISHKVNEKILELVPSYYSGIKGGDLNNDISWVEKLQVKQTDQINMNYVLIPKHEIKANKISACVSENGNRLILYITNENYTDIANALANVFIVVLKDNIAQIFSSLNYVRTINYIELHIKDTLDPSIILFPTVAMKRNIKKFINVLVNVAEIFELPRSKINIFYDDDSTIVAFNRNKPLFFNLRCDIEH
ncbi:Hatpase-c domain protein [Gigaspora margarita]|uniref:Hatpase-c domain protein n=1 Tax=Gigaspora margarita TaxID=4874 RepID=A0A8H3X8K2_GIGMA|nr:Hatpase-c domain protein [Gigaspora margarita]